jgi:hypothetical protein
VIQDRRFAADGTHPYSPGRTLTQHDMMAGLKGDTMLVNGAVRPRGTIARGLDFRTCSTATSSSTRTWA